MATPAGFIADAPEGFEPEPPKAGATKPGLGAFVLERLKGAPAGMASTMAGDVKRVVETLADPKPSVVLPLALPGGGTVATRLGAFAAGKMLEEPSTSPTENLVTAAKGVVGDPTKPLSMVTSPVVAEAAMPFLSKLLRSMPGGKGRVAAADAARFGEAVSDVAPTLGLQPTSLKSVTPADLARTAEGRGLARIGAGKEAAVTDVEARLAAVPGQRPDFVDAAGQGWMRPAVAGGAWQKARASGEIPMPSLGEASISLRDANARLSEIGDMMRGLKPLDPRFPKDVDLKQKYGAVADDIREGIRSVAGDAAAAAWTAGQGAYRAGRGVLDDLLARTNLFNRRGQFTMSELQTWLRNPANRADLAKALGGDLRTGANLGAYERLTGAITRGAPIGQVDKLAGEAPGLLSGRGSYGFWRLPTELARLGLPNSSSRYIGRAPYTVTPGAQTALDLLLQRASAE